MLENWIDGILLFVFGLWTLGSLLLGWWLRGVTNWQKQTGTTEIPMTFSPRIVSGGNEKPESEMQSLDKD